MKEIRSLSCWDVINLRTIYPAQLVATPMLGIDTAST